MKMSIVHISITAGLFLFMSNCFSSTDVVQATCKLQSFAPGLDESSNSYNYTGECADGFAEGSGKYVTKYSDGKSAKFTGKFTRGIPNGFGTLSFLSGSGEIEQEITSYWDNGNVHDFTKVTDYSISPPYKLVLTVTSAKGTNLHEVNGYFYKNSGNQIAEGYVSNGPVSLDEALIVGKLIIKNSYLPNPNEYSVYTGQFKSNLDFDGYGVFNYVSDMTVNSREYIYQGNFNDGEMSGKGSMLLYKNKFQSLSGETDQEAGQWEESYYDGTWDGAYVTGTLTCTDGSSYPMNKERYGMAACRIAGGSLLSRIFDVIAENPVGALFVSAGLYAAVSSSNTSGSSVDIRLLSCAGQAMAGNLAENPVASGAITEAVRSAIENDHFSISNATTNSAESYISSKLRESGHSDAANMVDTGNFILCALNAYQ